MADHVEPVNHDSEIDYFFIYLNFDYVPDVLRSL